MRRLSIRFLRPGMQLAQSIISSDGQVLLTKGQKLKTSYIHRLSQLGVYSVYVVDPRFPDLDAMDFLSEQTRVRALQMVRTACTSLVRGSVINAPAISEVVDLLIGDLADKPNVLVNVFDIRLKDDYTFAHSVNVCSFAILIGMSCSLPREQLRQLAVGALLHDLGKTVVPDEILQKPGPLSPDEYCQVQAHASAGFTILRKQGDISLLSAHIAFQHHERFDGSGYPRGLAGSEIHPFGRIVAVADVYDALVSDRPYRARYLPHKAAEVLRKESGKIFDPKVVEHFLDQVAFYPTGTLLYLSTGVIGVVVDVNKPLTTRPIVRVLYDADGNDLGEYYELNLSENPDIHILEVVSDETRLA